MAVQSARQVRVVGVALLALLGARGAVVSAQEGAAGPTPSPVSIEPEVIAAGEIPQRAEETFERLREIGRVLEGREEVERIRQQLGEIVAAVQALQRDPLAQRGAVLTLRELEDFQQRWVQTRDQLGAWSQALAARATAVDGELAKLRRLDEMWAATDASAGAQGIPRGLRDSIRSTRANVSQLDTDLRAWRATILTAQGSLAQLSATVAEELAALDAKGEQMRKQLLVSESEPLWANLGALSLAGTVRLLRDAIERNWNDLTAFARARSGALFLQGIIFLVLLVSALRVRQGSRRWQLDDAAIEMIGVLRDRPVSAAILIAALLGPLLYPASLPRAVASLGFLLVAIPTVRLLRVGVFADLPTGPLAIAGLLFVLALAELLPAYSAQARLILLAENVGVGVWLAVLIRPARLARLRIADRWRRLITFSARLGQLAAAAAFIANVVGNVSLSVLLTHGTFVAMFAAVALQASSGIIDGAFIGFLSSRAGRSLHAVRDHGPWLRQRAIALTTVAAVVAWVLITLVAFGVFAPVLKGVTTALQAELSVGTLHLSLGDVLALGVTIWVSFAVARLVSFLLETDVLPHLSLPRGVPGAISISVRYSIALVGFFAALSAAGVNLSQITVLVGAFGVGLSFGLQNIVNNFVSGLILIFERPIQVGDTVEVAQIRGEVRGIGIRSSLIRTFDGADVIVPNGNLISSQVVNWTFSDRQRRIDINVGAPHGSDPQQVIELLLGVARAHPDVLQIPPPVALLTGFAENRLDFSLRAWTVRIEGFPQIRSDLGIAAYNALRAVGIPPHDAGVSTAPAGEKPSARAPQPGAEASAPPPSAAPRR